MRLFWTMFFVGSLLMIGADVRERRETPNVRLTAPVADGDAYGAPTPRP